jgi:glycyl-tRNA synthetase beta chain
VVNIIRKAREEGQITLSDQAPRIDPSLFQDDCEKALYQTLHQVRDRALKDVEAGTYDDALVAVSTLKPAIDAFFDGVMVLTEDERIKQNRLILLSEISDLFATFADFSKIST